MTGGALALVLAAAVLHAGWNALAKRGTDPLAFLALCSCVAAPVLVPLAAPMLWRDGLSARAVPFVLGTIALHVLYFYALGRAYSSGAYSVVYPIARGLGVALVPVGAYMLLMEAGCGLVLFPAAMLTRPEAVRREWSKNWRAILAVGAMSAAGYTLVLLAFRLSKAGYVVAARELSIVLSALIGTLWMDEGRVGPRLAAATSVLAGVACVALAR